jgi:hypothetical protein
MPGSLLVLIAAWGCVVILWNIQARGFFVDRSFQRNLTSRYGSRFAILYMYLIGSGMIAISLFVLLHRDWWE